MLSRLVITFLPRSKCLLIAWLQSPSAVILEPRKIKSDTVSTVSPSISHEVCDQMPWSSFSECWALSQLFHSPLSLSSTGFLVPLTYCHKGGVICISEVTDTSPGNLDSETSENSKVASQSLGTSCLTFSSLFLPLSSNLTTRFLLCVSRSCLYFLKVIIITTSWEFWWVLI